MDAGQLSVPAGSPSRDRTSREIVSEWHVKNGWCISSQQKGEVSHGINSRITQAAPGYIGRLT